MKGGKLVLYLLSVISFFSFLCHLFSINHYYTYNFQEIDASQKIKNYASELDSSNSIKIVKNVDQKYKYFKFNQSIELKFSKAQRRLPQCIIIGVRKGGTRALLEFLNLHPLIQKASDEVHFFDDDIKYNLGLNWYRNQMPYSFSEQVTIEKSPAYFVTESAPSRIHAMNSSIKLILIVRDPVIRLISDYAQLAENRMKKSLKVVSFEDLVLAGKKINISYKPVQVSMYSVYYKRWIQTFPSFQLHIVDGDKLVNNPFSEVRKTEKFLGLNYQISPANFSFNSTKKFFCIKVNETLEKCLNESKGRPHPQIKPEVIQLLRRFYTPYNRKFYHMVGKNFGWAEF